MILKADIRIATGKQYEFSSYFCEGTLEEIRQQEQEIRTSYNEPAEALPMKEWNLIVDAVLANTLKLSTDTWERMSQYQQSFLQEIKRSRNRV